VLTSIPGLGAVEAAARQSNSAIATFYQRPRRRGNSKRISGGAIARKLAE
jgi:hypothetical protein